MTKKEKEKIFYTSIKKHSKTFKWKFKSYFSYKVINDFLYEVIFIADTKENRIYGWISFKPTGIDEIFWEIIGDKQSQQFPLSYSIECAVKVDFLKITDFDFKTQNIENIDENVNELFQKIESIVALNSKTISTINEYIELLNKEKNINNVAVLTCLIKSNNFKTALEKINEYRNNKIKSRYSTDANDYFQLTEKYCNGKI